MTKITRPPSRPDLKAVTLDVSKREKDVRAEMEASYTDMSEISMKDKKPFFTKGRVIAGLISLIVMVLGFTSSLVISQNNDAHNRIIMRITDAREMADKKCADKAVIIDNKVEALRVEVDKVKVEVKQFENTQMNLLLQINNKLGNIEGQLNQMEKRIK